MIEHKLLFRIKVTGRVQGVGFRQSCLREARYLGIKGYVKNIADGSVYIEAESGREVLNKFVIWLKNKDGYGYAEELYIEESIPENYKSFEIRY